MKNKNAIHIRMKNDPFLKEGGDIHVPIGIGGCLCGYVANITRHDDGFMDVGFIITKLVFKDVDGMELTYKD